MNLLKDLYEEYDVNQNKIAVKIIREIQDLVNLQDFESINDLLIALDFSKAPNILIISLARGTYAYRQHLHDWEAFVVLAKTHFKKQSEDTKYLLRGL